MNKSIKKTIETEGKTAQEAIRTALNILGVTREKVNIKILSEGKRGLYGMGGSKAAKVKVTLK